MAAKRSHASHAWHDLDIVSRAMLSSLPVAAARVASSCCASAWLH